MDSTQVGIFRDLARFPPESPAVRKQLYKVALELLHSTGSAQDTAQRLYHGHIPPAMAHTSIDLGLFKIVAENTDATWTMEQLEKATGAGSALLYIAMMTMLAAMEWKEEHFAILLQETGLKLREVIRYDEEYGDSLIVAVPAKGK